MANVMNYTGTPLASCWHQIQNAQLHTHRAAVWHTHLLMYTTHPVLPAHGFCLCLLAAGHGSVQHYYGSTRTRAAWSGGSCRKPNHGAINKLQKPKKNHKTMREGKTNPCILTETGWFKPCRHSGRRKTISFFQCALSYGLYPPRNFRHANGNWRKQLKQISTSWKNIECNLWLHDQRRAGLLLMVLTV